MKEVVHWQFHMIQFNITLLTRHFTNVPIKKITVLTSTFKSDTKVVLMANRKVGKIKTVQDSRQLE